jgi:hypothetical protein
LSPEALIAERGVRVSEFDLCFNECQSRVRKFAADSLSR